MRRSLRTRLILSTTLATAAVLLAAGLLLYVLVRDGLVAQFDRALLDKARLLASATEWEDGELDLNFDEFDMHEFQAPDRPAYLQVWLTDGAVAFRSPSLAGADLQRLAGSLDAALCRRVILPDGRPGRATNITMTPKVEGSPPPRPSPWCWHAAPRPSMPRWRNWPSCLCWWDSSPWRSRPVSCG